MLRKLIKDTTGASAIEYAVIASLVSVAAIGAFLALGQSSTQQFDKIESAYEEAN